MEQSISLPPKWNQASLIAFRFFFVYFVLHLFPFPWYLIPYSWSLFQPLSEFHSHIVEIIAKGIFKVDASVINAGSGDAAVNYVNMVSLLFYSLVATLIFSVMDRKRNDYEKLSYGLSVLLRYYLAIAMLQYGFAKIFRTQFPFPSIDKMLQSYGESSPMGLLWTFMGYSTAYNIFIGLWEVVGGCLLFFKRTRLLGALLIIGVMSNVVMLNLSYDVPVKLHSMHLLTIAIFLAVPDANRLVAFFFNKPVEPYPVKFDIKNRISWVYAAAKVLILFILLSNVWGGVQTQRQEAKIVSKMGNEKSYLGEFEVERFVLNGETIPPDPNSTSRWKKVLISGRNIDIQYMDGGSLPWLFHGNDRSRKIVLLSPDLSTRGNFDFRNEQGVLSLEGLINEDSLKVVLRKKSENSFVLSNRGFHWVSNEPFYR